MITRKSTYAAWPLNTAKKRMLRENKKNPVRTSTSRSMVIESRFRTGSACKTARNAREKRTKSKNARPRCERVPNVFPGPLIKPRKERGAHGVCHFVAHYFTATPLLAARVGFLRLAGAGSSCTASSCSSISLFARDLLRVSIAKLQNGAK